MSRQPGSARLLAAASAAAFIMMLTFAPLPTLAQASPVASAPQASTEGGVTVKVTPVSIGESARPWEFSVVFDTHSAELTDDLMQSATLTTSDGRKLKPIRWAGPIPGGHHREGVLSFDVRNPAPGSVELSIARQGESAPRIFRWPR